MTSLIRFNALLKLSFLGLTIVSFVACGSDAGGGSVSAGSGGGGTSGGTFPSPVNPGGGDGPVVAPPPVITPPPTDPGTGSGGGSSGGGTGTTPGTGTDSVSINPGSSGSSTTRSRESFSGSPAASGLFETLVTVANTNAFQIVSQTSGFSLVTLRLTAPGGETVLDSGDNDPPKTLALYLDESVNSLNYPTSGDDAPVTAGEYDQRLYLTRPNQAGSFSGDVIAKNDPNLIGGALRVNIFLVGTEAQKQSTRTVVDSAIALWRTIYSAVGIALDTQFFDVSSSTGILPNPSIGSSFYLTQTSASGVREYSLNLFVGEDISADATNIPGNSLTALGVSGGIPGSAIPSVKSCVAVSLSVHSGGDGAFDADETALLGETMAHESGHYLGLFHPVEISGAGFVEGDSLNDTPDCSDESECVANGIAANNMFPVPVSGQTQRAYTTDQREVVNLNVIVD